MQITKKVTFVAKESHIDELKALLVTMVEPSRNEEGCILYNIYQTIEDPKTFVVIETWENEAALEGHKHSAHYKYYKANFEVLTAEKYSDNLAPIA